MHTRRDILGHLIKGLPGTALCLAPPPPPKLAGPPLLVAAVLDLSDAMAGDNLVIARNCLEGISNKLRVKDFMGAFAYNDRAHILSPVALRNTPALVTALRPLRAGGDGKAMVESFTQAFIELDQPPENKKKAIKNIVYIGGGHSPVDNLFTEIIPALEICQIGLTTISVGRKANTSMLKKAARVGGGRFFHLSDIYSAQSGAERIASSLQHTERAKNRRSRNR